MAQTAAHLIDHVLPSLPVRQWVISFPKRLRYFLHHDSDERIIYYLPKRTPDGRTMLQFTPLELIGRIAALLPEPRFHRHRYYGVLAPNARLRPAVTALDHAEVDAGETDEEVMPTPLPTTTNPANTEAKPRSSSYYPWARLLARLFEVFPLTCPLCGGSMRIISFITDGFSIRRILNHIGEPAEPPPIAAARGPPLWEECAEPFPEYNFDQQISW